MKTALTILTLLLAALFPATVSAADRFEILPDYHMTPKWVKAGAYFKHNGQRVRVSRVNIHVMLPVSRNGNTFNYKTRDHNENNVGEPDWSGWWHEPWEMGHFYYTVTANYAGKDYKRTFVAGRNKGFQALENAAGIAKALRDIGAL